MLFRLGQLQAKKWVGHWTSMGLIPHVVSSQHEACTPVMSLLLLLSALFHFPMARSTGRNFCRKPFTFDIQMYIGPDNIPIDFKHLRSNFKVTEGSFKVKYSNGYISKTVLHKISIFLQYVGLAWGQVLGEIDPQGFIRDFVIFAFILII